MCNLTTSPSDHRAVGCPPRNRRVVLRDAIPPECAQSRIRARMSFSRIDRIQAIVTRTSRRYDTTGQNLGTNFAQFECIACRRRQLSSVYRWAKTCCASGVKASTLLVESHSLRPQLLVRDLCARSGRQRSLKFRTTCGRTVGCSGCCVSLGPRLIAKTCASMFVTMMRFLNHRAGEKGQRQGERQRRQQRQRHRQGKERRQISGRRREELRASRRPPAMHVQRTRVYACAYLSGHSVVTPHICNVPGLVIACREHAVKRCTYKCGKWRRWRRALAENNRGTQQFCLQSAFRHSSEIASGSGLHVRCILGSLARQVSAVDAFAWFLRHACRALLG